MYLIQNQNQNEGRIVSVWADLAVGSTGARLLGGSRATDVVCDACGRRAT